MAYKQYIYGGQAEAIEHPLEQPFHKELLKKEELRNMAMEFEFIFKGNVASLYGNFLRDYENALAVMYQYQIIIKKMEEEKRKNILILQKCYRKCFQKKNIGTDCMMH